ncbi:MAG: hypothetical protein JRH16_21740 [Deltaproteobacteria bacterium]|nr:hypothetical protein [Deltaproteobacteria bacterium]MBW2361163.1 hypothetical protein [Deltaproteobacteria bacterium]
MQGWVSDDAAESEAAQQRLRTAIRTNRWIIAALVVAVASPLFIHYTGFKPAKELSGLTYPKIFKYSYRTTPGRAPHHGIDFSQIWLSAGRLSAGQPVYHPVDKAKWRRRWSSTYHPVIHWLYVPLGRVAFPTALVVHNLAGIGLLLLVSALALRRAGCTQAIPSVLVAILAAMYLTPVGLFHLERGQLDVFVAASIVCVVTAFVRGGSAWAIAAGAISMLKVQAWIFVGFFWLVAAALWGLRDRNVWWVPATILGLNLIFLYQVIDWVPSFLYVANNTSYFGPTFTRILPRWFAFGLPFVSTALVGVCAYAALAARGQLADTDARRQLLARISFPFAAALTLQTVCGTPVTHDYRLIALLGLLPVLATWCARGEGVPAWLRRASCIGFGLMLMFALRVAPLTTLSFLNVAQLLLAFSLLFLLATLTLAVRRGTTSA